MLLGHKTRSECLTEEAFWMGTVRNGVVPAVMTLYLSKSLSCVGIISQG